MKKIEISEDGVNLWVESHCSIPIDNIRSYQTLSDGSFVLKLIQPIQDDEKIISPISSYSIPDVDLVHFNSNTEERLNQLLQPANILITDSLPIEMIVQQYLDTTFIPIDEIQDINYDHNQVLSIRYQNDIIGTKTLVLPRYSIRQKDRLDKLIKNKKFINQFVNQNFNGSNDFAAKFIDRCLLNDEKIKSLIKEAFLNLNRDRDELIHCKFAERIYSQWVAKGITKDVAKGVDTTSILTHQRIVEIVQSAIDLE